MSEEDDDLRLDVVRACRVLSGEGLVEAFGHVSARLSSDSFLISPRKGLATVSAGELLTVEFVDSDHDLEVTGGGPDTLPVEAVMHSAIYRRRSDAGAICRDHGQASSVFGIADLELRPVHALGALGGTIVPVFNGAELICDWRGGRAVADALGDASAVLLRGNGRAVVGSSVSEACARAILIEESARLQLSARCAGRDAQYLTQEEIAAAVRDVANPGQIARIWNHYCRKHRVDDPHRP